MRKQIVAGNWKMNTTKPEGKELAQEVAALSAGVPEHVGLIVAPPFTHLCAVNKALAGSRVELSAQNCAALKVCVSDVPFYYYFNIYLLKNLVVSLLHSPSL